MRRREQAKLSACGAASTGPPCFLQPLRVRTSTIQRVIRTRFAILGVAVVVAAIASKRGRRARKTYAAEMSAGSRPIEAVGTAIAASSASDAAELAPFVTTQRALG